MGFLACVGAAGGTVGLLAGASFAVLSSMTFDASLQIVFPPFTLFA